MTDQEHFRVSSHLKDIIGQDLVTNEFVAVFELVKNSFDAGASRVDIVIDNDRGDLWIVDDGRGMDAEGIRDRWLFVAYSAKKDGTEGDSVQVDYRDRIKPSGQFAGSKGIGRFSCDTLGGELEMYTRTSQRVKTQVLQILWSKFEEDSRKLFQRVSVSLQEADRFPENSPADMPHGAGTALKISQLRNNWDESNIFRLRQYLEKLIDPFGTTDDTPVNIKIVDSEMSSEFIQMLSGPIGNDIKDLLAEKTTRIKVELNDKEIRTELIDRGRLIYRISEENSYAGLEGSSVNIELFYLNRSAKVNFSLRMGVKSVQFGSIFLFLNGFRVFPIGEETDDTFGLNRRKQQGTSRYLGTRDLIGRIDITAPPGMFREASSRDAGLIEDAVSRELYDAVLRKAVRRLERYVVGVTWQDRDDQSREDSAGFEQLPTRSRAAQLIAQLAESGSVKIDYFDPDIVELFEIDAKGLDEALQSLVSIAESRGDRELLARVKVARERQAELEKSERESAAAAKLAREAVARADVQIELLTKQATYLASTQDMTVQQMSLLLHQVLIYAGHIGAALDRGLANLREAVDASEDFNGKEGMDKELSAAAAAVRHYSKKVLDDLEYIHLENDRLMAVARFASNARFELETDVLEGDIVEFLDEYVNQVRASRDGAGSIVFEPNDIKLTTKFAPVDLVVVVDNLMDNARKHGARQLRMTTTSGNGRGIEIKITDDGRGLPEHRVDPRKIFDKGYSDTEGGTGLGLFHVRQVLQKMGGSIDLDPERPLGRADFIITFPGGKK